MSQRLELTEVTRGKYWQHTLKTQRTVVAVAASVAVSVAVGGGVPDQYTKSRHIQTMVCKSP